MRKNEFRVFLHVDGHGWYSPDGKSLDVRSLNDLLNDYGREGFSVLFARDRLIIMHRSICEKSEPTEEEYVEKFLGRK